MTLSHIKELQEREEIHIASYGLGGSRAYRMHTELSDFDYGGIYIIDPKALFCDPYLENKDQFTFKDGDHEGTVYEFDKAFKLIADCNPNMLELIWRDRADYIIASEIQEILIENRELLLSKKAKFTFSGYAHSQFKRIKNHNKMLNSKYKEAPNLFLYPDNKALFEDHLEQHKKYLDWYNGRNPARRELEDAYGYDTKHAGHLIRLMLMGIEILEGKGVNVKRDDAVYLRNIRNGCYSYEELAELFEELDSTLEKLYETSELRRKVNSNDIVKIRTLVWECYNDTIRPAR